MEGCFYRPQIIKSMQPCFTLGCLISHECSPRNLLLVIGLECTKIAKHICPLLGSILPAEAAWEVGAPGAQEDSRRLSALLTPGVLVRRKCH